MMREELSSRMRSRANEDKLPADHQLRRLADELDEGIRQYAQGEAGPQRMVGCWARAKRAWSEYSGEPLIA